MIGEKILGIHKLLLRSFFYTFVFEYFECFFYFSPVFFLYSEDFPNTACREYADFVGSSSTCK